MIEFNLRSVDLYQIMIPLRHSQNMISQLLKQILNVYSLCTIIPITKSITYLLPACPHILPSSFHQSFTMARVLCAILLITFISLLPGEISAQDTCAEHPHVIVCYYASWGIYRPTNGTFKIEFIDPKLCTHLIYSFAGLNLHGMIDSLDTSNDMTLGG